MHGFYRSGYRLDGKEQNMATTQFESTYARKAFPCWDEPAYKAEFDVVLNVPSGVTALSNAGVASSGPGEAGLDRVVFKRTPMMSTYLVAFAIGNFGYIEKETATGVKVRIYAVKGKEEQGKFALDVAVKALDYYDNFFEVPYPMDKCDLIAIPDFSMGAMENWGLITYREVYLLVDEQHSSQAAKCAVALVVAHELAHMWFGNLATMKWWTDLWLKEGFATFMEYMFLGAKFPEFQIWNTFATDEIGRGFCLDALRNSHPIEVPIANPNELDEIYDAVSYAKSCSVIGMLQAYLGEDVFQKAAASYLKKFSFRNAETVDLWAAFSAASGQDVAALMASWTKHMGFPLLTVSRLGNKLSLGQDRFLADGSKDIPDEAAPVWTVPINMATASTPNDAAHKVLLKDKEESFTLDGLADGDWLKLNAGMRGFYRVQYSAEMLAPLLEAVKSMALGPLDRLNLTSDTFALVRAAKAPASDFLNLLKALSAGGEKEFSVWSELDSGVGSIQNCLKRLPTALPPFKALVAAAYGPTAERLGWDPIPGENYLQARLRSLLLARLVSVDHAPTIQKALELFRAHDEEKAPLNADLRNTVFNAVGSKQGRKGFQTLCRINEASELPEVQRACLLALASAPDSELHADVFRYAMDKVRNQDLYLVFASAIRSAEGQASAWKFVKENWDALVAKYENPGHGILQHIIKFSASSHAEEDIANDVTAFFADKGVKALDRPVAQCCESIRLNANFLARNKESLPAWLEADSA